MAKTLYFLMFTVLVSCSGKGPSPGDNNKINFNDETFTSSKLATSLFTFGISNKTRAIELLKVSGNDTYIVEGKIGALKDVLLAGNQYRLYCEFVALDASAYQKFRNAIDSGKLINLSNTVVGTGIGESGAYKVEYVTLVDNFNKDLKVTCRRFLSKEITVGDVRSALSGVMDLYIQ